MLSEYSSIFQAFGRCLELRDKYMGIAGHMLGFNPKDHDGHFTGLDPEIADVDGVRPDVHIHIPPASEQEHIFEPWNIYPKPPPPHWHWMDKEVVPHKPPEDDEEFDFDKCEIPGPHGWDFELDEKGVYQVYENVAGEFLCAGFYRR